MMPLLALAAAYFLGGIPFGYYLVRFATGRDVRTLGSGNIGATNVLRTTGRAAGVVTLLLDIAKGFAAVWLAAWLTHGTVLWTSLATLAVMAGHAYPLLLHFKGGKAVASFLGAFLYLAPLPVFATLILFIAVVAYSRYISLGSLIAAGSFPFAVWLILHPPVELTSAAAIAGAFIIYRHKSNIARLRAGTENVLHLGGKH